MATTRKASAKSAPNKTARRLSHVGRNSRARMVDVTDKADTVREAKASGQILISKAAMALVRKHSLEKGPVTAVARFAGIQAAKRTSDAIPMCHPLLLSQVDVAVIPRAFGFEITATSPDGVIEAMEKPGAAFCIGVQWHPENFWRTGEFRSLFEGFVQAANARTR